MRFVKSDYCGEVESLSITPIGDLHIGHVNYVESIAKDAINSLNFNNRGLLTGDMLECATKESIGKGLFDTSMTPKRQKEYCIELLRPKAKYIDGAVIGNHEMRIMRDTSLDLMEDICKALDIPYLGFQGFVKYAWNGVAYVANVWHGNGGGGAPGTALKRCEGMAERGLADIYIMGHFHKLIKSDRIFAFTDTRNMNIIKQQQHFICNGSALDYNESYADEAGLQARSLGFATIEMRGVKGEKNIKVTL